MIIHRILLSLAGLPLIGGCAQERYKPEGGWGQTDSVVVTINDAGEIVYPTVRELKEQIAAELPEVQSFGPVYPGRVLPPDY